MNCLSPVGSVYQAGTLSGNPLAVAAGRATLSLLTKEFYEGLNATAASIEEKLRPIVEEKGLSFARVGSMFTVFFRSQAPRTFHEVNMCDLGAFGRFHALALKEGIYFPPSQYEAVFLCACMTPNDVDFLVQGVEKALALL